MAMKNVKNVNFWQVDHKVRKIFSVEGIVILSSQEAWEKFSWTRKFFEKKPKEGYFIWVKKQTKSPLITCISIASQKVSQDLLNLAVIEKGIFAKANVFCNSQKNNLCGRHKAKGKLILKEGAVLEYEHIHKWGERDFVSPDYEFILEKNSRLTYNYQNLFPPENLQLKTTIYSNENSSCNLNFVVNGLNSKTKIEDTIFLKRKNSQGIVRLKLIGRKNSQIEAISRIFAEASGKGHLECQGLLIDEKAKISLSPELVCQNKNAQLTHEASIGKISEEELIYLRMRGLTEKQAIDLIINGFLKI